jgi:TetR/AcrR family transcriptional regulator, transcriptional repressor for nem operon
MTDTKEYIIDEAFKLFLSQSYEAVSISDICNAIGLTKGALYHHFKSKEELFYAVIDRHFVISEMEIDVNTATLKDYNEIALNHTFKILKTVFNNTNYNQVNYLSLIADSFRHYKGFSDSKVELFERELDKIRIILDNAILRGEIRKDVNTLVLAQLYFSTHLGMAGELVCQKDIDQVVITLKKQFEELYNLLKI